MRASGCLVVAALMAAFGYFAVQLLESMVEIVAWVMVAVQ